MSQIYLAFSIGGEAQHTYPLLDWEEFKVSMLVSYVYLPTYRRLEQLNKVRPAQTMLDSGAFSAWNSGTTIDLPALTQESKVGGWDECVALDVVGDGLASLRNARLMKAQGSKAFPVFHFGEDMKILDAYCHEFKKVGLSCRFGEPLTQSIKWLSECFKRSYPFPFHSFGWAGEKVLTQFPFHSADTASWATGPAVYGRWRSFGGAMSVRGKKTLEAEVRHFMKLERFLKARWKKELSRWLSSI